MNSRLDTVQAVVLNIKLKHLADYNRKRWEAAEKYTKLLSKHASSGLVLPDIRTADEHVFHLYVIQVDNRDRVIQDLAAKGVSTVVHYPNPYHLQGGYTKLGYKQGDFPITEKISSRILSLPIYPEITDEQIQYVCASLLEVLN
jgi:dTDP-4-amino-4,6-dideoxygalactose transaminase